MRAQKFVEEFSAAGLHSGYCVICTTYFQLGIDLKESTYGWARAGPRMGTLVSRNFARFTPLFLARALCQIAPSPLVEEGHFAAI